MLKKHVKLEAKPLVHLKNHHHERRLLTFRCYIALSIIIGLMLLIIGRIAYLQIIKHAFYTNLAQQNRIEQVPIAPNRGLIFDRNGELLAKNTPVFNLELVPDQVSDIDNTITQLQLLLSLSDNEIQRFYKTLRQKRPYEPIPIRIKLTPDEVALFAVNQFRFPGVSVNARLLREYPKAAELAHVIGYVGRINSTELKQIDKINYQASNYIGKTGLEQYYETVLHGQVGYQRIEIDAAGNIVRAIDTTPAQPGINLYLSIDLKLQQIAEQSLSGHSGAIVAIDPQNGDVLAMVSLPSYDPNLFVQGISQSAYQRLANNPERPMYNRTIRGLYAPGSTIKPFIAVSALAQHFVTADDEIIDPGYFKLAHSKHVFHDWKRGGHGRVNLHKAIVESSDTYFYWLAYQLKIKHIAPILDAFGFGSKTGLDLSNELSGTVPSAAWKNNTYNQSWYPGDTLNTGIGQGYTLVTPLQLAVATATLAMHGIAYQPRLIIKQNDQTLLAQKKHDKQVIQNTNEISIDNPAWSTVIAAMQGVIQEAHGTGFRFGKDASYTVAGKTGTAQVYTSKQLSHPSNDALPKNLRDNGLFIAFAPIEQPRIALAIITEHTDTLAPIIARKMMDYYLKTRVSNIGHLNITNSNIENSNIKNSKQTIN